MNKYNLKKELKEFYRISAKNSSIVEVPESKLIVIIGRDTPRGPTYKAAINEAVKEEEKTMKCLKEDGNIVLKKFHKVLSTKIIRVFLRLLQSQ